MSTTSNNNIIRLCLIAPLSAPHGGRGGIGNWTGMILDYISKKETGVSSLLIDSAPRLRKSYEASIFMRIVDGAVRICRILLALLRSLICFGPDVVHMTTAGRLGIVCDICVIFFLKIFRIPVVYHIRFGRIPKIAEKKTMEWRFMALALRSANSVIVLDHATFQTIKEIFPQIDLLLIPNCINLENLQKQNFSETEQSNEKMQIMYLGWIVPAKGIEELVSAWAILNPNNAVLYLYGPGNSEYRKSLLLKYQPSHIVFGDEIDHDKAMEVMKQMDVFVLPSYTEGFPNAILEAMVQGCAIIATEVGAIPEMLADGRGLLIPPKDILALKNAIFQLINDVGLRESMSLRAKDYAIKHFSIEVVFQQLLQVWLKNKH